MEYKEQGEHNVTRGTRVNNYTVNSNIVAQLLVALTHKITLGMSTSTDHVLI